MLIFISAVSGMMFSLVPLCRDPTVTTAAWFAPTSRETTVWRRITTAAAITTGSTVFSGADPWPPRPKSRTAKLSEALMTAPGLVAAVPAGMGPTCCARHTSGRGKRSANPSSIMACAPLTSSAGWKTATTVPRQASRSAASRAVAPSRQVTCMSCPQACMTGTSLPSASTPVRVEA